MLTLTRLALPTTRRILLTRTMASSTGHLSVAREIRIDHDNVRDLFDRYAVSFIFSKNRMADTLSCILQLQASD
jgi:hypothetical protein